jgi:CIC family chloride channel protein
VKFLAGIISMGGGISLGTGRAQPSSWRRGVSSLLGQWFGVINLQNRAMTACGAAAGLAAAFNTPIAGVTFVLEEILENLNSRLIGRLLLASFVSVFVLYLLIGDHAVLALPQAIHFYWRAYLMIPLVSALAALVGIAFQNSALGWSRQIRKQASIPLFLRPFVGAVFTWAAATLVFATTGHAGVLGLGYGDLNACLAGSLGLVAVTLLLLGKWAATTASYAWGGCGGIFAPTLCLGAFTGALCGGLLSNLFNLSHGAVELLTVAGMSACLGAVVRAPVTSIMIVFEMTHDFALVPPLMLGALISQFVSRRCCKENFYSQVIIDRWESISPFTARFRIFPIGRKRRVAAFATMPAQCLYGSDDPDSARESA